MKSFVYVLTVSSLMICNPVFLLAKHNYTDNVLTTEEEVQLQLSLLEGAAETFNQAERLENGNYQIQTAGSGGVLAFMAYMLLQLQKADPSDVKILDPRQLQYFGDITDPDTLRYLRTLRESLKDTVITLRSNSPSSSIRPIVLNGLENNDEARAVAYRGSADDLNVSSLERSVHNLSEFDDRIVITSEGRAPVILTSEVTSSGAAVTITSPREAPVFRNTPEPPDS